MEEITDLDIKEQTQGFSLKDKSALIVGCGGLGCNIAVHLAGAGIGKLMLCDFDLVSSSNLNRQFLYTKNDVGKKKAVCAKERLSLFAPDCEISVYVTEIDKADDIDVKNCDIIFAAVDNDRTRLILIEFAEKYDIPLVLGGIDGFYGMAQLYVPKKSSPFPMTENSSSAAFSVSSTAGIIGSAQAALGIRYLLTGDEKISENILIYDETEFSTLRLK